MTPSWRCLTLASCIAVAAWAAPPMPPMPPGMPPPGAPADPCSIKVEFQQVHDPTAEPGYCERMRDAERQHIERDMRTFCDTSTANIGGMCAARKRDLGNLDAQYRKCVDQVRYTRDVRAKEQEARRKFDEMCRKKPSDSIKLHTQTGSAAAPRPGFGGPGMPGANSPAVKSPAASMAENSRALIDFLQQQQESAREEYINEINQAGRNLDKIQYGSNFKTTERIGHSDEKFEDMVDDPPPERARPPNKTGAQNRVVEKPNSVLGPGNGCPDDSVAVSFSCRIPPPSTAVRCESQTQPGSTQGPTCFGALACCVTQRNAFSLMRAPKACPIRTCWGQAGKETIECPDPTNAENASCQINWGPADWPSVAACPRSPASGPAFPAPPPSRRWTAAECSSLMKAVADASPAIDALHKSDRQKRQEFMSNGADVVCPHACAHGVQLDAIAKSIEVLRDELQTEAFNLKQGSPRRNHLEQAELYARDLSWHLRFWMVQPLNSFEWTVPNDRGPYYVWSDAFTTLPWPERTITSVCAELFEAEKP